MDDSTGDAGSSVTKDIDNTSLQTNESVKQLADTLPAGLAIINHKGEPVFINGRFQNPHFYGSKKYFDSLSQSIHQDDCDRVESAYQEALRSKSELRIQYRARNQPDCWQLLLLNPLGHEDVQYPDLHNHGGFTCTVVDITAEKTAEIEQAKSAQEAQEHKEKQERFIDMISHEIRNPLSAILHCTEDIIDAVKGKKAHQVQTEDIIQAAEIINLCILHQKKVVDDVLLFSKLDASMLTLSPRIVLPRAEIPISLKMFQPELRNQDIQFEYRLDPSYIDHGIDWVRADLTRISQVIINLFSNAIKFTAKTKGTKRIALCMGASLERPPSYPPNIVFFQSDEAALRLDATSGPEWGTGEPAYIMVAVSDNGIGISTENQKRLFERFNQATPKTGVDYGGSGLGLNVCRKLCHLHGGEIGVSSKEGDGSTFGFFFKVLRSSRASHDEKVSQEGESAMDKLCNRFESLGHEDQEANSDSDSKFEISDKPIVTPSSEVMPSAADDERTQNTAKIVGTDDSWDAKRQKAADGDLSNGDKPETESPGPSQGETEKTRILLVEDNIINQRIISRKLKSLGFEVSEANDGHEALEAAQTGRFNCILMDKEMPVMDGNAATRAIRQSEHRSIASVPVIGITANVRPEQENEMKQAGMDCVIHKPYRMEELVERINQATRKEA
ncbi:uncharacterized protein ASPGLDRAFT_45509 [Aspergillus glaucus CBS 516.65]|uniref:Histidine kinase n=1 Tax=Aspergillus glaucus CBS 516.65 TaxID=1160497 RepID=A0A1L9VNR0_ASPGL|nr:hypothetical protein ASPGLDRAFT_45509 [Aspergillus glaucus CBS 516.65]OJJ85532.1 hypothetical protein ASPGLDRAFT_45509 [Aspergillus glaucus CBS 516.65]